MVPADMQSTTASADTYYAPNNVPADNAGLYSNPVLYSINLYIETILSSTSG